MRRRLPELLQRFPRRTKMRLVLLLVTGGVLGAFAATSRRVPVQLGFVAAAVMVGIYAGLLVRRVRAEIKADS